MTTQIASYLFFLLASAYTALAATPSDVGGLVSREYNNPDPANDPANFFGYVPQKKYIVMALLAFGSIAASQTYLMIRYRGQFMLAMLIAEFTFAAGIGLRWPLAEDPTQKMLYIAQNTLIVLSPCGFIAANYVLLGRMARWLKCNSYMLVRPERVTLFFVGSDVITFLVQAAGGGISAAGDDDADKALLGSRIFLVGLILQAVSFVFFTGMYIHFIINVKVHEPRIWNRDAGNGMLRDWRGLAAALFVSCLFILVRSGYRIAELSQGFDGAISKQETLFYLFDVLCLFHAVMVYTPYWPGKFITGSNDLEMEALRSHDSSENLAPYKARV